MCVIVTLSSRSLFFCFFQERTIHKQSQENIISTMIVRKSQILHYYLKARLEELSYFLINESTKLWTLCFLYTQDYSLFSAILFYTNTKASERGKLPRDELDLNPLSSSAIWLISSIVGPTMLLFQNLNWVLPNK